MAPTTPLQLYRMPVSGHCHRVELMLSLLGLPHQLINVDLQRGEHRSPQHLRTQSARPGAGAGGRGHSASATATASWFTWCSVTRRAAPGCRKTRWARRSCSAGSAWPRACWCLVWPTRVTPRWRGAPSTTGEGALATGKRLLDYMEGELQGRVWLLGGDEPSLADIAMFSYTSQAHIAGLPLAAYPRIAAWVARLQALPGYVPLADTLAPPTPVAA